MTLEDSAPQVRKYPICYWGRTRGKLLIALERMKRLGQSRNDAQLWGCLVMKVKCVLQYCIGNWNVRSTNQGKLDVDKEMGRWQ